MEENPNIYEKLNELLPYEEWVIFIIAILGYLFFKLLEKALPALFKQISYWLKNGISEWRKNFKTENNLRKFISNSSKRNWITSIKTLSKYNLNIDLLDVFQPPLFYGYSTTKNNSLGSVLNKSHSFAILGKMGSGKSSICNYLSYLYANDSVEKKLEVKDVRLPFFIACGLISDFSKPLYKIISEYYEERGCSISPDFIKTQLRVGKCIIILDGLDEIVDYESQKKAVNLILDCKDAYPKNRFVVSCRELDWEGLKIPGFQGFYISDLDSENAKLLIQKWANVLGSKFINNLNILSKRIDSMSRDLGNVYSNYLLLTVLIILSANGIRLEDKRTEIYDTIIKILINEWSDLRSDINQTKKEINSLFKFLQKISSFLLFSDSNEIMDLNNPTFMNFATGKLQELFEENKYQDPLFVLKSLEATGIIIGIGNSKFKFVTRIFLEYLSALDLKHNFSSLLLEKSIAKDNNFETVLLFFELTENRDLIFKNLVDNTKSQQINYFRLLSGLLIRKLVPSTYKTEIKESVFTFFKKTIESQRTDKALLENCFKIDKTSTLKLFEEYMQSTNSGNLSPDLIALICKVEDEQIIAMFEANFTSLDKISQELIIKEISQNRLASNFLWNLAQGSEFKVRAIESIKNNGIDNYFMCYGILEDKIILNGQDSFRRNRIESKLTALDVLKAYNNPETIKYLSNNFKNLELILLNYILISYGENYFKLISKNFSLNNYLKYFKRPFDFVFSIIIFFILLAPVLNIVALLIKVSSKGPVFFYQNRVGRKKKVFKIYKFRTMSRDYSNSALQATRDDYRITPIGKFLRKFNIDELPVIMSVISGDMSLVGPRAELPILKEELSKIQKYNGEQELLKYLRPGFTSIRNIGNLRHIENREDYIVGVQKEWDYMLNASLFLDLKILAITFWLIAFSNSSHRGL